MVNIRKADIFNQLTWRSSEKLLYSPLQISLRKHYETLVNYRFSQGNVNQTVILRVSHGFLWVPGVHRWQTHPTFRVYMIPYYREPWINLFKSRKQYQYILSIIFSIYGLFRVNFVNHINKQMYNNNNAFVIFFSCKSKI